MTGPPELLLVKHTRECQYRCQIERQARCQVVRLMSQVMSGNIAT